jgi:hydroxypyruvate isomerase
MTLNINKNPKQQMERRKFLRNVSMGGAVAGLGAGINLNAMASGKEATTFNLNYAPHFGMFKSHAGDDLIDQLNFMYEHGFRGLEDNGLMRRTPEMQEKIGNELSRLGMEMGVFVLDKGGNAANSLTAGNPEFIDIFIKGCKNSIDVAKRVNAKWITVVPGNFERSLPLDIQTSNVIEALRKGAEILEPHGLIMVLEPLSDTPDLYLRSSTQTNMICKAVNSPSCKLLYDAYHMQRNEGDLIRNIDHTWDEIAYFQIGDNPGRKEPGTGEIYYRNVFKHIYDRGFRGIMGMEHGNAIPGKEGELALIEAYRQADQFM